MLSICSFQKILHFASKRYRRRGALALDGQGRGSGGEAQGGGVGQVFREGGGVVAQEAVPAAVVSTASTGKAGWKRTSDPVQRDAPRRPWVSRIFWLG